MARSEYGRHKKVTAIPDDPAYDVGADEWNGDAHDQKGIMGFDGTLSTLVTGAFLHSDAVHVIAAESGVADDLTTITATDSQVNDLIMLYADAGDTITVKHGTGNIQTDSGTDETLSETVPMILFRRGSNWYQFASGGTGGSQTPWTSDIDADGFDLIDLSNIEFRTSTGAPAATSQAIYANAGGIIINVPTGDDVRINFNGVNRYILAADSFWANPTDDVDFNLTPITQVGTISHSGDTINWILQTTNAGVGAGTDIMSLRARNNVTDIRTYGQIDFRVMDAVAASEDGQIDLAVLVAGTLTDYFVLNGNTGLTSFTSATNVSIAATNQLFLDGGGNTYVYEESADVISFVAGGVQSIKTNASGDLLLQDGDRVRLDGDFAGDTYIDHPSVDVMQLTVGAESGLYLDEDGTEVNVVIGAFNILATTATSGFLYIPYSSTGAFTGVPVAYTGKSAFAYDQTNNNLMVYDVGEAAWKSIGGGGETFTWTANHSMAGFNLISAGSQTTSRINLPNGSANSIGFENNAGTANHTIYLDTDDIFKISANWRLTSTTSPSLQTEMTGTLADDTIIGSTAFRAEDGLAVTQPYARILAIMESDVDTAEQGSLALEVLQSGTNNIRFIHLNDAGNNAIYLYRDTTLQRSDATAILQIYDNVTTPADATSIARISFKSDTDTTEDVAYAQINILTGDVTNATSSGQMDLRVRDDNVNTNYITLNGETQLVEFFRTNVIYNNSGSPFHILQSLRSVPADYDIIGTWRAQGYDDLTSGIYIYGRMEIRTEDVTNTSRDGATIFWNLVNGTDTALLRLNESGDGRVHVEGDIEIPATNKLFLDGGGNTSIRESAADTIALEAGGSDILTVSSSNITANTTLDMNFWELDTVAFILSDDTNKGTDSDGFIRIGNSRSVTWRNAANTGNAKFEFDGADQFVMRNTLVGSDLVLQLDKTVPADFDVVGRVIGRGDDDLGNPVDFAKILFEADDVTSTTKDSSMIHKVYINNVDTTALIINDSSNAFNIFLDAAISSGNRFYLDGVSDTSIRESAADTVMVEVGGSDLIKIRRDSDVGLAVINSVSPYLSVGKADMAGSSENRMRLSWNTTSDYGFIDTWDSVGGHHNLKIYGRPIELLHNGTLTLSTNDNADVILQATKKLFLDGGGNTSIRENTADLIMFETGGTDQLSIEGMGLIFQNSSPTAMATGVWGIQRNSNEMLYNVPTALKHSFDVNGAERFNVGASQINILESDFAVTKTTDSNNIIVFRDDATPTVDDFIGSFRFDGKNAIGTTDTYFRTVVQQKNITNGTEESYIFFQAMDGGTANTSFLEFNSTSGLFVTYHDVVVAATKRLYLDGGNNTSIYENAADSIGFEIAGTLEYTFTASGITLLDNDYIRWTNSNRRIQNGTAGFVFEVETGDDYSFEVNNTEVMNISPTGSIDLLEKASADADTAGLGQIWVKNDTPNTLWFTDDAGTDFQLGAGGATILSDPINITAYPSRLDLVGLENYDGYAMYAQKSNPSIYRKLHDNTIGVYTNDFTSYANDTAFDTDFPSYGGTALVNPNSTNDRIDFTINNVSTLDSGVYLDLGTIRSDSLWIVRFKVVITTMTTNTTANLQSIVFGLSENTSNAATAQDFIGVRLYTQSSAKQWYAFHSQFAAINNGGSGGSAFAHTPVTETLWVEIKRNSTTTYTVTLFSDEYVTSTEAENPAGLTSSTANLRYLKIAGVDTSTATGNITGYIQDVQVIDETNVI